MKEAMTLSEMQCSESELVRYYAGEVLKVCRECGYKPILINELPFEIGSLWLKERGVIESDDLGIALYPNANCKYLHVSTLNHELLLIIRPDFWTDWITIYTSCANLDK